MSGDIETSREERKRIAEDSERSVGETEPIVFEPGAASRVGNHIYMDGISGALRANAGDNQQAVVAYNQAMTGDVAKPLTNKATDSDHIPVVLENHPQDSRVKLREDGIFQTLDARMGMGGGNIPMVMEQPTCLTRRFSSVNVYEDGITPTLEAGAGEGGNNMPMVIEPISFGNGQLHDTYGFERESVCVGNGQLAQAKISDKVGALNCMHDQQAIMTYGLDRATFNQSVVRRLTPLECERLQGFPDGWTDIGEWIDSKGKKHKDADSPRYKALGNSIALPFWEWMAGRMIKQLNKDKPTMASLFDGIGGFPLVFSRYGCEPVWASEIEEFPMAVTERRFNG